jgi:hypothetical protein
MAECQTVGEPCTGFHECCTGLCADPGTGVPVCQTISGCRPVGEVCLDAGNCCSGTCEAYQETGIKRCEFGGGCLQPGELCWEGQPANCCPSGPGGGQDLCLETILGLQRCFTQGTENECLPGDSACAFGGECCSGVCTPDAGGDLVCTSCVPLQGACTADPDCCDGLCIGGTCEPNYNDCEPIGGDCTQDADCCSNICNQTSNVCSG